MKSQIKIFEQGKGLGVFSANEKFYPEGTSKEERDRLFAETRIRLGEKLNLDGRKIFQAHQKTATNNVEYEDGKYIVITKEHMTKLDYWNELLYCDILIISKDFPNIIVGNQMADCPVIIVEDRKLGVTALAHCGASYIDRKLPVQTVEALQKEYNSNLDDLYVYITAYIGKENYTYDCYPKWATNKEVWEGAITKDNDIYHIDMLTAIIKQLSKIGIKNIEHSKINTYTDPNYYSHAAIYSGHEDKKGQNFVGFYYTES